jgi:hypothetical protein
LALDVAPLVATSEVGVWSLGNRPAEQHSLNFEPIYMALGHPIEGVKEDDDAPRIFRPLPNDLERLRWTHQAGADCVHAREHCPLTGAFSSVVTAMVTTMVVAGLGIGACRTVAGARAGE